MNCSACRVQIKIVNGPVASLIPSCTPNRVQYTGVDHSLGDMCGYGRSEQNSVHVLMKNIWKWAEMMRSRRSELTSPVLGKSLNSDENKHNKRGAAFGEEKISYWNHVCFWLHILNSGSHVKNAICSRTELNEVV